MIPKNRIYKRVDKGVYIVNIPVAFTRKEVRGRDWNTIQDGLLQNVAYLLSDAFQQVEQDVRNKK